MEVVAICGKVSRCARPADGLGHRLAVAFVDPLTEIASASDALTRATADILIAAHLLGAAQATHDLAVGYTHDITPSEH